MGAQQSHSDPQASHMERLKQSIVPRLRGVASTTSLSRHRHSAQPVLRVEAKESDSDDGNANSVGHIGSVAVAGNVSVSCFILVAVSSIYLAR